MTERREDPFARYLARVASQLRYLEPEQRAAIVAELRAYLEDAAAEAEAADERSARREAVDRLGAPDRLRRELAWAYETVAPFGAGLWLLAGAAGILLTPLLLIAAFTTRNENLSELLLLFGGLSMTLAAPAVHVLCRPLAPQLSLTTLLLGLAFGGGLLTLALFGSFFTPLLPPSGPPEWLMVGLLCTPGLWGVLSSLLLLGRAAKDRGASPDPSPLIGPALLSLAWGPAWLIGFPNFHPASRVVPPDVQSLALFIWMGLGIAWCLWMAVALVVSWRGPSGDLSIPASAARRQGEAGRCTLMRKIAKGKAMRSAVFVLPLAVVAHVSEYFLMSQNKRPNMSHNT